MAKNKTSSRDVQGPETRSFLDPFSKIKGFENRSKDYKVYEITLTGINCFFSPKFFHCKQCTESLRNSAGSFEYGDIRDTSVRLSWFECTCTKFTRSKEICVHLHAAFLQPNLLVKLIQDKIICEGPQIYFKNGMTLNLTNLEICKTSEYSPGLIDNCSDENSDSLPDIDYDNYNIGNESIQETPIISTVETEDFFQDIDQDYSLISEGSEHSIFSKEQSGIMLVRIRENLTKVNVVEFESVELLKQAIEDITKVEDWSNGLAVEENSEISSNLNSKTVLLPVRNLKKVSRPNNRKQSNNQREKKRKKAKNIGDKFF